MSLYTPVVFTDDPPIQKAALEQRWAVVQRDGENPALLRILGIPTPCSMPQPRMSITGGSLDAASAPAWGHVLDWLARFVHKPLPVVAADDYATELALWAAAGRGWPLGALVHDMPTKTGQAASLYVSAAGSFVPDPGISEGFSAGWPAPVHHLENSPLVDVPEPQRRAPTRREDGVTKVLLTSYYCAPDGAERINHWFEHLEELSGGAVGVDLATATAWPDAPANVHRIPDYGVANLTTAGRPLEPWAKALLHESANSRYAARLTPAGFWHLALEKYFHGTEDEYDAVICCGGPYGYYDFAHYAKQRWFARTILSYEEPFANNPATEWEPGARDVATYLEAGWNMNADVVLALDAASASLVVPGSSATRVEVAARAGEEWAESTRRLSRLITSVASHSFDPSRSWLPAP